MAVKVPTPSSVAPSYPASSVGGPTSRRRRRQGIFFRFLFPPLSLLLWPSMLTLPLFLGCTPPSYPTHYSNVFPSRWYDDPSPRSPKPLGLFLGILAVAIGQIFVIFYHYLRVKVSPPHLLVAVQRRGAQQYNFAEGVRTQIANPEGFVLLGVYLAGTWLGGIMPASYYDFSGGIDYLRLGACLALQDFVQYVAHRMEHVVSHEFYKVSHKPHHRFTNPRLFDAFNGSALDTICMILVPLYITAWAVPCNVWTYMAFGSCYANWLTLIHSEFPHVWDGVFKTLGLGTPGDHHVHHKYFNFNFGHLFMWADFIFGTHRSTESFPRAFNEGV